jgi:hypothetical protein
MDRPGTNPDLRGKSPATNRLKHDKATKTKMNCVLHYKDALVIAVYGNSLYCENRTEHTHTLCGQNGKLLNVAAGDECTNH